MAWYRRERLRQVYLAIVLVVSAVQGYALFITRHINRGDPLLGASFFLLNRILAVRIFVGATLGTFFPLASLSVPILLPVAICVLCAVLIVAGLWHAPLELKLFTLFATEVFAAALWNPLVAVTGPQWPVLLAAPSARYYLFPMLAFLLCVARAARSSEIRWVRIAAIACLCALPIGVVRNWKDYGRWQGFAHYGGEFPPEARRFEQAPKGTVTVIELAPGAPWSVTLTKH
jgi:hypothetical protein